MVTPYPQHTHSFEEPVCGNEKILIGDLLSDEDDDLYQVQKNN